MAWGVLTQQEIDDVLTEHSERKAYGETPSMGDQSNDAHLVDYVYECVKESFESSKNRREFDEELWRAHENDVREYSDKEAWQSKIVTNRPFTTAVQAASIVRRGMIDRPDYFTLEAEDPENPISQIGIDFWNFSLKYWTNQDEARFQSEFADASHFGFAVGKSQFIKFLWQADKEGNYGLRLKRFESWKEYDDPERTPRRPWSGLYNIHEEWVDYYQLEQMQEQGSYRNVESLSMETSPGDAAAMWRRNLEEQREEERRRSGIIARNKFRKAVLVREFWGTVLDANGRLLHPNVTFTVAGNQVIRGPIEIPFPKTMRWPWVDWSALPHPVKYHGYGLYEGVMAIWKLQNNLLNLYLDNENFRINQMYEIDPSKLKYPGDTDVFPGKQFIRKSSSDGPAVLPVPKGESNLQDVNFIWAIASNLWENGSFVTEFVKGEQGSRKDVTATEINQKTQQAMGVFDSIGRDTEEGAVIALKGIHEFLQTYWFELDRPEFKSLLMRNPLAQQIAQGMMPDERMVAMALKQVTFRISGVSKAFEKAQIVQQLLALATIGERPMYQPYMKYYNLIRRFSEEVNQPDCVLSPIEVKQQREQAAGQAVSQAISDAQGSALEKGGMEPPNPHAQKADAEGKAARSTGGPMQQPRMIGQSPAMPAAAGKDSNGPPNQRTAGA